MGIIFLNKEKVKVSQTEQSWIVGKLKTILSICCLWNLFQFDPDLVLVSAGFDSAQGDPKVKIGLCTLKKKFLFIFLFNPLNSESD